MASSGEGAGAAVESVAPQTTGLPWALAIGMDDAAFATAAPRGRAMLLGVGLAAILLLVGGGGYLLWRVIQRELAVSRLQTEFVSAVSHEFRTPLTSLRHMTELLTEGDDLPGERRAVFYQALDRDTRRLQRLVESLLDFARMQDGRRPYDLRSIDAAEFARGVVDEFRASVDAPEAAVNLDVAGDEPLTIRADSTALGSALWNLLDNAVKYSPDRPVVNVGVHRNGAGIAIDVRDEGPGIPRDEQQEIFGRFVRGADASRRGIRGTGLGLSMVAHIVAAHGGTVAVASEPGAGSTFTMTLPAEEAH
jgi:signal transduction histidine kinase